MKNFAKAFILMSAIAVLPVLGHAQQYTGISGFLHIPSAEMNHEGDARIGAHFLNKSMTPDTGFLFGGEKYNTFDYYFSITPYRWMELSYTCTKRKIIRPMVGDTIYGAKDCYLSVKIRPLEEGNKLKHFACRRACDCLVACFDAIIICHESSSSVERIFFVACLLYHGGGGGDNASTFKNFFATILSRQTVST